MRFGLVGTGPWAGMAHGPGLAAAEDVDLVGVWGRSPEKSRILATGLGVSSFESFEALLEEVDAVAFAVPPEIQAELALVAANAGKHLLLDKPVAMTVAGAHALRDAATSAGVASVVFFTDRFADESRAWFREVRGTNGWRGGWLRMFSSLQEPDNPFGSSPWRWAGGALWDVGPHALSQLLPALGPVSGVVGARGRGDLVHVVLTHESGVTSVMSLCMTMPTGGERVEMEFYDDHGWHSRPDRERDVDEAYERALSELLANVAAGETGHRCDVRFGRDVVAVLARCEAALAGGGDATGGSPPA